MTVSPEKRSHPRVKDRLTLRSTSPAEGASEMSTTDLSLGGAQVVASRFVPLMTRVEVTLLLPPEEGIESGPRPVRADAVVVRVHPPAPQAEIEHYQIALFFSHMEQRDRNALARYLSSQSRGF
jgi:c-di-GMP-binding flagellar brake protein YcgR